MTVRVAVHGAAGRMGAAVLRVVLESEGLALAAAIDRKESGAVGSDVASIAGGSPRGLAVEEDLGALARADVAIDFTTPDATAALLRACAARKLPAVIGTTGLPPAVDALAGALAAVAPVVVAPNFSQGVTMLFHLAARAAELLGPAFDAEIVEMHHGKKADAPSGTALELARVVTRAKGLAESAVVHGRSGRPGARPAGEVGVLALRGGDVVGEHTLYLAGTGERIELTHRATDRAVFARGAARAAAWVVSQPPGRYDMADVMGVTAPRRDRG
jgi:4-hydroxy-tetrahydrodipicolinate reductase